MLDAVGGYELAPPPINSLRTELESLIRVPLREAFILILRVFKRKDIANVLSPPER